MTARVAKGPTVWVTRAEPGASRTAARLMALGYAPRVAPLIRIEPLPATPLDLSDFDGLVFTSLNGVAAFAGQVSSDAHHLPVVAVGDVTAQAARDAGWTQVTSASGDVGALADLMRRTVVPGSRWLHPGAVEPAGDLTAALAGHAEVQPLAIYRAVATNVPLPTAFDVVLIHSPRAGRELAALAIDAIGPGTLCIAISPAAATPLADLEFTAVHIAETPDETGILSALKAALGKPPAAV